MLSIQELIADGIWERERREREDWAFEVALLLRNRFLAHEFCDEFYDHAMTRKEWDTVVLSSEMMTMFRKTMSRRIIPNLKRIVLGDRIRPHYHQFGLLEYENGRLADDAA